MLLYRVAIFQYNVGGCNALVVLFKLDMDFCEKFESFLALGCNVLGGHRELWKQLSALALAFGFKIDRKKERKKFEYRIIVSGDADWYCAVRDD